MLGAGARRILPARLAAHQDSPAHTHLGEQRANALPARHVTVCMAGFVRGIHVNGCWAVER